MDGEHYFDRTQFTKPDGIRLAQNARQSLL